MAFKWSSDMYSESVVSFANGIKTSDGGSHVDGFRATLTRTVRQAILFLIHSCNYCCCCCCCCLVVVLDPSV